MKFLLPFFLSIQLFVLPALAQRESNIVIEDPSIKKICNDLNEKREKKKSHRQALVKLLKRNDELKKRLNPNQKKVFSTLERLNEKIEFEIKVAGSKIEAVSEKIIRSGCPPIDLEGQKIDELATQDIVNNIAKQINIEKVELEEIESAASSLLP